MELMDKCNHHSAMEDQVGTSELKRVFDRYADETISDEQTNRLLASVFSKLEESNVSCDERDHRPQRNYKEVLECSYA